MCESSRQLISPGTLEAWFMRAQHQTTRRNMQPKINAHIMDDHGSCSICEYQRVNWGVCQNVSAPRLTSSGISPRSLSLCFFLSLFFFSLSPTLELLFKYQLIQTNTPTNERKQGDRDYRNLSLARSVRAVRIWIRIRALHDCVIKVWSELYEWQLSMCKVIVPNWIPSMCRYIYFWQNHHVHIVNKIISAPLSSSPFRWSGSANHTTCSIY